MEFYCDGCGSPLSSKERSEGLYRIEPCEVCQDLIKDTERQRVQREIEDTLDAVGTDTARLKRENEYFLGELQRLRKEVDAKDRELVYAHKSPREQLTMLVTEWLARRRKRKAEKGAQ